MGVPKFFRYISERYPCLSELVKEYQIPEFDNLYLDMNGIIHMCSHPNDFDPHFRITEERIFKDIFHYLEILFQLIKPRKLFFMAVDGVAPRAKMNQQRGRRFRSAKEAEVLEKRAEAKGEKLPEEARFDSNCITPGTVFMARLHEQLKYFVTSKISYDQQWKGVKVILSGHETPGEGEHKIMEYIRWMKTQPGYDPNTRHCLYGLDADLMMLGLCTHEPHFSLLREEVKFGKQSKRTSVPEETRFYLLHLSLMREYLDLEFQAVKDKLKFPYDLESIIDDWVMMGFLVGNDFIPHLPDVHIASGALPMLYNAYMEVLPTLDGYINEKGYLKLDRFQKFMEKLAAFDINQFKETYADLKYFESKTNRKMGSKEDQCNQNGKGPSTGNAELDAIINATNEMVLEKFFDDDDAEGAADSCVDDDDDNDDDEDDVDVFGSRVYADDSESEISDTFRWEFHQHKKHYYRNKLDYGKVTEQVLKDQAEGYVRAIQWNLHYYYHGVASWSWYYPHHYAPYVSDICNFKNVQLSFELGEPFKPFEQLLAVLPSASKKLLPAPYWELMVEEKSPIIQYYPLDFETDLNGKKQDWEAVVLIPFIDEERLLKAMIPCQELLSDDEKRRNQFGPMLAFTFTEESLGEYKAPEYFPVIKHNRAHLQEITRDELCLDPKSIVHGLLPGVRLDVYFPGFPTFAHLPYSGELKKAKVQVFDQASRGDNMILTLLNVSQISSLTLQEAADRYLGKDVYCGWPHLAEAKVVGVADGTTRYNLLSSGKVAVEKLQGNVAAQCEAQKKAVANEYMRRQGVDIGEVNIIVYACHVEGRKYVFGTYGKITLEKIYSEIQDPYAIQAIVDDITVHDPSFVQFKTLEQVFPVGSKCFLLASPVYGSLGEVLEIKKQPEGRLIIKISTNGEPDVDYVRQNERSLNNFYMPGSKAAQHIGISSHVLSRITGTVYLVVGNKQAENPSKTNIGLNLKFNKKNEEVPGFTRKENNMWLYSKKAVALIRDYVEKFPEIFEHLSRNSSNDIYDDKDIYPGNDCTEKVSALTKWLKEVPCAKVDRQPCGAEILDEEVVGKIQDVVKTFVENPPSFKRLKLQVKPHTVFKSELRVGNLAPDPSTTYHLFDRVVNVRDDIAVPLGLKGTIIGIKKSENAADTMFDILFDRDFPSSLSLAGSKGCAYRVSRTGLINISHGCRQGLIHESYRFGLSADARPNSAFASWGGRGKAGKTGNNSGTNWRAPDPNKSQITSEHSPRKRGDAANKPQGFKFPAPPNIQLLPKEVLAPPSNERLLWNQLQMVSEKNSSVKSHPVPPLPETLPKPNENMTNVTDNKTNVLKLMLGVKSSSESEKANEASAMPDTKVTLNIQKPVAQSCELEQHSRDACGLLMNFFQRKGVGVPLYSVAAAGAEVVAELKLPDGTTIISKPAPTKQMAAENAAIDALHLLKFCHVCDKSDVQQPIRPVIQCPVPPPSGQISVQPQQFFQQFRQGQHPPPTGPGVLSGPPGHPGWQQSANRPTLVRTSFPQGPLPFPQFQAMQHPPRYPYPQPAPNVQFNQRPSYQYPQQLSPHKKQLHLLNNHQQGRDNSEGSKYPQKQPPQRQYRNQNHQKAASKESNAFVPLQALKKQRNPPKSEQQDDVRSKNVPAQGKPSHKKEKVEDRNPVSRVASADNKSNRESGTAGPAADAAAVSKQNKTDEPSSSRSVSRLRKSRLAINFQSSPSE